jgi:predicted aminopeptidase
LLKLFFLVVVGLGASACATLGWYGQAVSGHLDLLARREHIADLIHDPATDPALAARLGLVLQMREFAVSELGLPDSRSYSQYADIEREAVVWNVIATPADDLAPKTWCYPITGCLAYRAYFRRDRAESYARRLADQGMDVAVAPAVAYSTLGWFADPVLSTMLAWDDARLAGFIFHELTHEKLFVPGETAFNEAYATAVEREGVRRWLLARDELAELDAWERGRAEFSALTEILLAARERLAEVYAGSDPLEAKLAAKAAEFERLSVELQALAEALSADWIARFAERELNNAHLAHVATYEAGVAAFEALLVDCEGELACLHRRVKRLAESDSRHREVFLQAGSPARH